MKKKTLILLIIFASLAVISLTVPIVEPLPNGSWGMRVIFPRYGIMILDGVSGFGMFFNGSVLFWNFILFVLAFAAFVVFLVLFLRELKKEGKLKRKPSKTEQLQAQVDELQKQIDAMKKDGD